MDHPAGDHVKRHSPPFGREGYAAWRYYARFYAGSYRPLALSAAISVAQSTAALPIALLVRYMFDKVIPSGHVALLAPIGLALLLLNLLNPGATLWTRHISLTVTKQAIQRVRETLLEWCYARSRTYYSDADRGRLHSTIILDTERVDVMSNALTQLLPAVVTSMVLVMVLFALNWRLSLLMVGMFPLVFIMDRSMRELIRMRIGRFHQAFTAFSKGFLFVLQMMDLTRIQAAETLELQRQRRSLELVRVTSQSMAWLTIAYHTVQQAIVASFGVVILVIGGASVVTRSMTLGELLSFIVAFRMLGSPLSTILSILPPVIEGHTSLTALFALSRTPDALPYSGQKRIAFEGRISLESVSFKYEDKRVLHGVTLSVAPQEIVGIVGANGSGKTTLVHLVLGFYRPQEGRLYADGHPFDQLDMRDLRRQMGVVMQDPIIFPGTVLENIAYGCCEADMDRVVRAAQLAMAHEFVQQLPQGYDTAVGENGMLLSGGQRQRIAVARALLRQPRLLILDEPNVHLDEAAVSRLIDNLREMANRLAILVISHDPSVLSLAQRTHVLLDGRIVDTRYPLAAAKTGQVDGAASGASGRGVRAYGAP